MSQKKSQQEFELAIADRSKNTIDVIGIYRNSLNPIHFRCNVCHCQFQARPSSFLLNAKCHMCKTLKRLGLLDFVLSKIPKIRVLVIDPDKKVLKFCENILKLAGFFVSTCNTSEKGIDLYQSNPYDLIISDLLMPEIDSLKIYALLKNSLKTVNMIIMTNSQNYPPEFNSFAHSTKLISANEILEKPFTKESLLAAIKQALKDTKISDF